MNNRSDNNARPEAQDGLIDLGAVSTETKGIGPGREFLTEGENPLIGIADE
ncbi:benenodin family lasso peptide [Luteimonas sp. RD2P54]|uniref:Benenodin family lasso peptide n=1 Tax=Luteimonas endophytica TaxID=3042023 RepID=A0ABT6JAQ2_9GAMM|nr:benenodin family lasso peptide [Luteimonas endophytica]MDH5823902.1 benenodin family lasso peptide [Luteimonas endophytica]